MEPAIRGIIEKMIDTCLTDEWLASAHQYMESLKPAVESREDALFGYILGTVINGISNVLNLETMLGKPSSVDKVMEAIEIIKRRIPEIQSRIAETFT